MIKIYFFNNQQINEIKKSFCISNQNVYNFIKTICIAHSTNFKISSIIWEYEYLGKPFIKEPKNFYISCSRSKNYYICAISNINIGIDIEYISSIDIEIAKKFFHNNEYSYIINPNFSKSFLHRFFEIWCIKESYLKLIGTGMFKELNSFYVSTNNRYFSIIDSDYKIKNLSIVTTLFKKNYMLSLVTEDNEISNITFQTLHVSDIKKL